MSEWISVKDKLPIGEDYERGAVLIAYDEAFFHDFVKEIDFGYFDHSDDYEGGTYGEGTWRFWNPDREVQGKGVTHWMSKPQPPEMEE